MPVSTRRVSSRVAGLGVYLPETTRSTAETEQRLRSGNPGLKLATGLIARMTGVETVHLRPDGWEASDLAVAAARQALAESDAGAPGPVDLVIFASASQDLVEPATSHIVAAKLGLEAPVMDVKNACNSVVERDAGRRRLHPERAVPARADRERRGPERRGAVGPARSRRVHPLVPRATR